MSWGTCYSGSNNIHFNFPPIMSDGRNFANWQPGASLSEKVRKDAGITTNWQYRKYLTENADSIIKYNQFSSSEDCSGGNSIYSNGEEKLSNSPFVYKSALDNSRPYGYENSDLKNSYLSKFQLEARMVTPVFTQAQLLQQGFPKSK
jgi:hypothetical protein